MDSDKVGLTAAIAVPLIVLGYNFEQCARWFKILCSWLGLDRILIFRRDKKRGNGFGL